MTDCIHKNKLDLVDCTTELLAARKEVMRLRTENADLRKENDVLHDVCNLLGIGSDARSRSVVMTNMENLLRRCNCLDAIENEFFTVEVQDEYDKSMIPECLLNWGHDPSQYVEQFRKELEAKIESIGATRAT